jgi:DNA-binding YbaB/EbfC family protein
MKDIAGLMKQAQEMQKRVQDAQAELDRIEVTGEAGGGLVSVTLSAKGEMRGVSIDPSLMTADDREVVEDLIKAAHGDAKRKADDAQQKMMADAAKSMPIPPGIDLPFGIKP